MTTPDEIEAIRTWIAANEKRFETWHHGVGDGEVAFDFCQTLLRALDEAQARVQSWSQDISGAIWAEIRSGLTGRFEEQFTLHQRADRYEMSSAHLDECARILTRRIEDKLWPAQTLKDRNDG